MQCNDLGSYQVNMQKSVASLFIVRVRGAKGNFSWECMLSVQVSCRIV